MTAIPKLLQLALVILAMGSIAGCVAKINCETSPDPKLCHEREAVKRFTGKYAVLIVNAIQEKWIQLDGDYPKGLSVGIAIKVDPGGDVLDVSVFSSSGYHELDKAAVNAILKASPLPISSDPNHYKHFRDIELNFIIPS